MPGIIQRLRLVLDTAAADQLKHDVGNLAGGAVDQISAAFKDPKVPQAARDAGLAAIKALEDTFRTKTLELQQLVAQGLLTPAAARRQGKLAADEFTAGLKQTLAQGNALGGVNAPLGLDLKGLRQSLRNLFEGGFAAAPKAAESVGVLSKGLGFLRTQVLSLVAPLAAFFTARELIAFGKESVKAFEEDAAAINDLRVNVERAGGSFEKLAPQVEKVNAAFQRSGRLSGSDFNRTLSALIGVTHDYENSLKNVSLVTDFAAKHNLTLEQATDLVGKAMVGNARGLREFGIEAKNGDDAIVLMRKDAQGFVDQQGPTFKKAINVLSFAWGDFKSAVGEAIVDAGGGTSAIDTLSAAILGLTKTLKANKGEISSFFTTFTATGIKSVSDFVDNTVIEFAEIERIGDRITAVGEDIQASFKRVAAAIEDAIAATLEFFGDQQGAAQVRALAQSYRDEATALEGLAKGHRDAAQAAKDDAAAARERLRLRESDARAAEAGISGGSSSTAGVDTADIPTGGAATRKVHPVGGGTGTDPEIARIRLLSEGIKFDDLREKSLAELARIEARLTAEIDKGNLSLDERLKRQEKLTLIDKAITEALKPLDLTTAPVNLVPKLPLRLPGRPQTPGEAGLEDVQEGQLIPHAPISKAEIDAQLVLTDEEQSIFRTKLQESLKEAGDAAPLEVPLDFKTDAITTVFDNIHEIAFNVASDITQVFSDTFSHLADGSVSLGKSFLNLGKGIAHSILSELAKLASGKVVENIANAIEEKARAAAAAATGNFAGAAAHSAAAASFLHAAASWGAVAIVAGAGAAATASGGGGGSGGGGPDRSAEGNDPLKNGRAKAEIIIHGGVLDTDNTAQMDALGKAISYIGDRDIVVRRA